MARKQRTVTIGVGEFTATCAVPKDRIGFFEAIGLTVRGWWDRSVNRDVPDDAHTHTLWWLEGAHRRQETEVVRTTDAVISAIDRAAADADAVVAIPVPSEQVVPTSADLAGRKGVQRSAWADQVRATRAANAAVAAATERQRTAAKRREELAALRDAVVIEGNDVRRQWAEAYVMRASRYTRARFGHRGPQPTPMPAVAGYRHTDGPTATRRDGGRRTRQLSILASGTAAPHKPWEDDDQSS
jgi:hypothetical protein